MLTAATLWLPNRAWKRAATHGMSGNADLTFFGDSCKFIALLLAKPLGAVRLDVLAN